MDPITGEVVWARRQLPEGSASWGKFTAPRWHRVALVNDNAIVTSCRRVFVAPMDVRSETPEDGKVCRVCQSRAASPRSD